MKKNRCRLLVEELESRLAPSATPALADSTNWSGYAVTSALQQVSSNTYRVLDPVTDVKGSWVVPKIQSTSPGENSYSSTWVGIDGAGSPTVEQIGTDSDVVNGTPTYYAWWEMYPGPSYYIKLAVQPGDSMSAEVKYDYTVGGNSKFTLTLKDNTTGRSFSTNRYISGADLYSAEWIEEAPSSASTGNELPLANFGTVTFSNAQATLAGKSDVINGSTWVNQGDSVYQINMVTVDANGNVTGTLAATSALNGNGNGFSVAFGATTPPAPGNAANGTKHGALDSPTDPNQTAPTLAAALAAPTFVAAQVSSAVPNGGDGTTGFVVNPSQASSPAFSALPATGSSRSGGFHGGGAGMGEANQPEAQAPTTPRLNAPPARGHELLPRPNPVEEDRNDPAEMMPDEGEVRMDAADRVWAGGFDNLTSYAMDTPMDQSAAALVLMAFALSDFRRKLVVDKDSRNRRPELGA